MKVQIVERHKNHESQPHFHEQGQFVYIEEGVVNLRSDKGAWLVPKEHLGWIPKGLVHSALALCDFKGWTILTDVRFNRILPDKICTLKATPLLLALLERMVHQHHESEPFRRKLIDLLLEEVKNIETEKLSIPLPLSPNLLIVARTALDDLSCVRNLEEWAELADTSKRTFTRHFLLETGMTFDEWRKNALCMKAVELLAQGRQVSDVAFDLGYESVSAFIAMFKKHFGNTPLRFFQKSHRDRHIKKINSDPLFYEEGHIKLSP